MWYVQCWLIFQDRQYVVFSRCVLSLPYLNNFLPICLFWRWTFKCLTLKITLGIMISHFWGLWPITVNGTSYHLLMVYLSNLWVVDLSKFYITLRIIRPFRLLSCHDLNKHSIITITTILYAFWKVGALIKICLQSGKIAYRTL